MENTKKFPRGISDQAIRLRELETSTGDRSPGPGPKQQAASTKPRYTPTGILLGVDLGDKPQASSSKLREK